MLYQDKFKGIISEETYTRIAKDTESSLNKIRYEIEKLRNNKKEEKVNKNDLKEYEDKIRQLVDIENPSRELLQAIIDKIIIDKDRNEQVDIPTIAVKYEKDNDKHMIGIRRCHKIIWGIFNEYCKL